MTAIDEALIKSSLAEKVGLYFFSTSLATDNASLFQHQAQKRKARDLHVREREHVRHTALQDVDAGRYQ